LTEWHSSRQALSNVKLPCRLALPAVLVAMNVAAGLPLSAPARAAGISLRLDPRGPARAGQGAPFAFRATIDNPGPAPVDVQVVFSIRPSRSAPRPQGFAIWAATAPAGGTVETIERVVSAQWFARTGPFDVIAVASGGASAFASLTYRVGPPSVSPPRFEDVTAAAGIDAPIHRPEGCRWAAGAAWGDIEGDGDLDLHVPRPHGPARLFVNDGSGHFTEQAAARGVDDDASTGVGAVFADFDRDGDQDLYVTNDGANRLYRNDGSGHFVDVAPTAGVADPGAGFSASWGDYDGDGWLDLYVTNYQQCSSDEVLASDRLFHNEGDGTFTDRTDLLPPAGSTDGFGFQAAWFDYDGDGDPDLYLANDSLLEISIPGNRLWRNDGPGPGGTWRFTDVSGSSGTGYIMNSMGIGVADFDRDLDLDFAVSNIGANVLAQNEGDGTFTDVAAAAGVERPTKDAEHGSITWGLAFADLNLDGWEDLYVNAGALTYNQDQPNEVFANAGRDSRFLDLSAPSGAADPAASRGLALADYDRDGRVDVLLVDQGGRVHLFRNVTPVPGRHWLEVRLAGSASNTDGCGARLVFTTASGSMMREKFCGSTGLSSGSDPAVHVGLGSDSTIGQLAIDWPSGTEQVLADVAADQLLTVSEPVRR